MLSNNLHSSTSSGSTRRSSFFLMNILQLSQTFFDTKFFTGSLSSILLLFFELSSLIRRQRLLLLVLNAHWRFLCKNRLLGLACHIQLSMHRWKSTPSFVLATAHSLKYRQPLIVPGLVSTKHFLHWNTTRDEMLIIHRKLIIRLS